MLKPGLLTFSSVLFCHFKAASSNLGGEGRGSAQRKVKHSKKGVWIYSYSTSGIYDFTSTIQHHHLTCQFSCYFLVYTILSSQTYLLFNFPVVSLTFLCKFCQMNDLAALTQVSYLFNWQHTKLTSAKASFNNPFRKLFIIVTYIAPPFKSC